MPVETYECTSTKSGAYHTFSALRFDMSPIVALRAADHLKKILGDRIGPLDLPRVDTRIVDP